MIFCWMIKKPDSKKIKAQGSKQEARGDLNFYKELIIFIWLI
jgi:hypothetical protein